MEEPNTEVVEYFNKELDELKEEIKQKTEEQNKLRKDLRDARKKLKAKINARDIWLGIKSPKKYKKKKQGETDGKDVGTI